jgi:uncharacterized protein (TIGR03435 family)
VRGISVAASIEVAALAGCSSICLFGQSERQASDPEAIEPVFASISVTADSSAVRSYGTRTSAERFSARNETAKMLIQLAYGVDGTEIVGLPKWADEEHFDINAVVDRSVAQQIDQLDGGGNAQVSRRLVQGVLENAFGLVVHSETLDIPYYELHTIDDGPRCLDMAVPDPYSGVRTVVTTNNGIAADYITMPSLAILLSDQLGTPVQDKTGLAGGYRISLDWSQGTHVAQLHPNSGLNPKLALIEALKHQLGLTLWKEKTSRDVLIVDRLERPETD